MDGAERLVPAVLAGTAVVVAADVGAYLVDFGAFHMRISALNGDSRNGVFQWILLATVASAAMLAAKLARNERKHRGRLLVLAAALAVLTLAETLHVRDSGAGPVLYVIALPTVAVLLLNVAQDDPARRLMLLGLACLAASLALHELGPPLLRALGWHEASWAYQVKIALKESAELAGWLLVACALGSRLWLRPPHLATAS
jgi:hypothetical protein